MLMLVKIQWAAADHEDFSGLGGLISDVVDGITTFYSETD